MLENHGERKKVFIQTKRAFPRPGMKSLSESSDNYIPPKKLPTLQLKKEPALTPRKRKILSVIALLEILYPQTFSSLYPKPLKVGIHNDILADGRYKEEGISALLIREALSYYTKRNRYRHSKRLSQDRINLEGKVVSRVQLVFSDKD